MRIKDGNKQQRIKEAMVSLILREGIDGTSVSKIAKEAGVSPATIYVYYNSKEEMLAEVFREYSSAPYRYLMQRVSADMDGNTLIETIVRGCYSFSREHEEIFSFVEQCSRCPTLSESVSEEECSLIYLGQQVYEGIFLQDNISNLSHIIGGIIGAAIGYRLNVKKR